MNKTIRKTVRELVAGIWIYVAGLTLIVLACMGCFSGWNESHTEALFGTVAGGLLASFMAVHMAASIDTAVDLGEQGALQYTRKRYLIRTGVVLALVVVLYYTGRVNILTLLAGLFGLKPAAYLQPLLHRIFTGKGDQEEDESDSCAE